MSDEEFFSRCDPFKYLQDAEICFANLQKLFI